MCDLLYSLFRFAALYSLKFSNKPISCTAQKRLLFAAFFKFKNIVAQKSLKTELQVQNVVFIRSLYARSTSVSLEQSMPKFYIHV